MGSRGPQRESTEALRLRGTRKGVERSKPKAVKPEPTKEAEPLRPIGDWGELLRLIPNYDPFRESAGYWFDQDAADGAVRFVESLRHVKGALAGTPLYLERWQKAVIGCLFGWKSEATGLRRYRECFLFVPRKNGKTVIAAAIILYMLFRDGEPGAEVYGAASEFKQACLVFDQAAGMIRKNAELSSMCKVYSGQAKSVQLTSDWSTYRVLSRAAPDANAQHGFNTHCFVIDEVHCLPDAELIDVMSSSTGARRQPLAFYISTSDYEREGSPCNELHSRAKSVQSGAAPDPKFLPILYEAQPGDDWTSPETWAKANPNLGISVSQEHLADECHKAQQTPRYLNAFLRLHLNLRTSQDTAWLPLDKWKECGGGEINEKDFEGRKCWCGLDLASSRDLTAFCMCFPNDDGSEVTIIPRFWVPRETAARREKEDRVPYVTWLGQGWIRPTEGETTDWAQIRKDINADAKRFAIQAIAIDRLFQGDMLAQQLRDDDGFVVETFGQGFVSYAGPSKRFEELVASAKLRFHNPVLHWHGTNVSVELNAEGEMKPSRRRSTEKIDGIAATVMAIGIMGANTGVESDPYAWFVKTPPKDFWARND